MERVTTALSAIKETGESGANSIGGFLSSSAETGVSAFKGTSLGESFFKNIGAIMVVVLILLGGIMYVDLAETAKKAASAADESSKGKVPAKYTLNQIRTWTALYRMMFHGLYLQSVCEMN
jgi:hypothetical protein